MGPIYSVVMGDVDVYEGTDLTEATRKAVSAYVRAHGTREVSVLEDGGTWRSVRHVPGDLSTAVLAEQGAGCLHPQCGQIHPLSCWCSALMSAEERERWRAEL